MKGDWRVEKLLIHQELAEFYYWRPEQYGVDYENFPSSSDLSVQASIQKIRLSKRLLRRLRSRIKHL